MAKVQRCSDNAPEPLPGTGRSVRILVALEYLSGWASDIMDSDALVEQGLPKPLKRKLGEVKADIIFIRKPGRAGQFRDTRKLFVFRADEGIGFQTTVGRAADVLEADLKAIAYGERGESGPKVGDVRPIDGPMMFVCTHGKRDACCAIKGRPVATGMQTCFYGDEVWECSHISGHRFAPAMILFPWAYSYGRISTDEAITVVKRARDGELSLPGNRGRGCWDTLGQVAELAVANRINDDEIVAPGQLTTCKPSSVDTEQWLQQHTDDQAADDQTTDDPGGEDPSAGEQPADELHFQPYQPTAGELAAMDELERRRAEKRARKEAKRAAKMNAKKAHRDKHNFGFSEVRHPDGRRWLVVLISQEFESMASCGKPKKTKRGWMVHDVQALIGSSVDG